MMLGVYGQNVAFQSSVPDDLRPLKKNPFTDVCCLLKKDKKTPSQLFYQQNGFIWEQQRIAIQDKHAIAKTIAKCNKQRRGMLYRVEVGSWVVLNESPLEGSQSSGW